MLQNNGTYSQSTDFSKPSTNEASFQKQIITFPSSNSTYKALVYCPFVRYLSSKSIINFDLVVANQIVAVPTIIRDFVNNTDTLTADETFNITKSYDIESNGYLYFQSEAFFYNSSVSISSHNLSELDAYIYYRDSMNSSQKIRKMISDTW
jgi:hypothetical protein